MLLPHKDGVPWPKRRSSRGAASVGFSRSHSHLLWIFDHLDEALDNMWLLDPRTGKWEEVSIDSNKQFKYILQKTLYDQYI